MLKKDLSWHFPGSPEEAAALVRGNKGYQYHAGGTGILRNKSSAAAGFVDLSQTCLEGVHFSQEKIEIGSMTNFTDTAGGESPSSSCPMALISRAAGTAASTPLRHRITVGGSIADSPPWSDLTAVLTAAEAEVFIISRDGKEQALPFIDYYHQKKDLRESLITKITLPKEKGNVYCYKRFTRVVMDYQLFSLALIGTKKQNKINDISCSATGGKKVFISLDEVRDFLTGKDIDPDMLKTAAEKVPFDFSDSPGFSAEYKFHLFKTLLKDGLFEFAGIGEEDI